jgi:S1-C subfamily serine protease
VPTLQVHHKTTLQRVAIAVAVNGGSLVITTAHAVETDKTVDLLLPSGDLEEAKVLLVDQRSGLAVLEPSTADHVASFSVATGIQPGDVLTFDTGSGTKPTVTATQGTDGSVSVEWSTLDVPEGTPIVNQRGELVGLCSGKGDSAAMVSLSSLEELQHALAAPSSSKAWLGVTVTDATTGAPTVGAVDLKGPAAVAGVVAGDVITAVDGAPLGTPAALAQALQRHAPGDTVTLTVQHADGTKAELSVTLAAAPSTA